jgi:probable rRNA maturation factor
VEATADRVRRVHLPPWRIDLTVRPGTPRILSDRDVARAAAAALEASGAPAPASVGVFLADDAELAALNERHMGEEGPTDVLSFPLLPAEAFPTHPGRAAAPALGDGVQFRLPPGSGRPHLGDIVISVDRAIAQAEEGRGGHGGNLHWAPAEELRLLVTHGVLHLCGWDHAEPVEEAAMRDLERRLIGAESGGRSGPA